MNGNSFSVCIILCCLNIVTVEFAVAETIHHGIFQETVDNQPALTPDNTTDVDVGSHSVAETAEWLENTLKTFLKSIVRSLTTKLISSSDRPKISPSCLRGLMKYAYDLTKTKVWAMKMLDSTSKLPAGLMEGTFGDFGSFDQCVGIVVPYRNGSENFRGMYCSIEATPRLPPMPKNFSTSLEYRPKPDESISTWYIKGSSAFHFLITRFGVCLPSSCAAEDVKNLVPNVVKSKVNVVIKKCYIQEGIKWLPVHFVVLFILATLTVLILAATYMENYMENYTSESMNFGGWKILAAFSLSSNWKKLVSTSQTNGELRVLHGIRFISLAWVVLGHTYIWANTAILRRPLNVLSWFQRFDYGAITNGWLAVDVFFFLSGLLTCCSGFFVMEKTNGRINIPLFMLYRYLRLTPSLMLAMGLLYFLPLISSGPFYDMYIDSEIESCRNNWWMNLLYVANWMPMNQVCVYTTWYLSADFQLFLVALLVLMLIYRSTIFGFLALGLMVLACNALVGILTYIWDLPPTVVIASGNAEKIFKTLDFIHVKTYTHVGPYFVGLAAGYIILKKKDIHLRKWQNALGWCVSITLSICSVYGIYQWNRGYVYSPFVSALYAALHRTTFSLGVAWVVYACVIGYGGPVNWILSSSFWVPLSRLTFMSYLLHSLVLWTTIGTLRERHYASHYNAVREFSVTLLFAIPLSVFFYLLVEAPFSRLLRMLFEKIIDSKMKEKTENITQTELPAAKDPQPNIEILSSSVELTAVKTQDLCQRRTEMTDCKINSNKIKY